ncbi:MAG: M50 family metallopeptidase [Chloroflexales bacterium]|nr:M50 family metallopeptidase [Chloroflexales bacterium]
MVTILAFLIMLGILVFVHELGHFAVARWMGIRVEEFGFGYPPRMLTLFERNGVKYTLNWLPLGGFVRFGGEDNTLYGTGSLAAAKPWRKIPVMLAGPLMNLLLAIVVFAALFATQGVPTPTGQQQVNVVYEATPAATAGFESGDILISINGQAISEPAQISAIAGENAGKSIPVVVQRGDTELTLDLVPGPWTGPEGQRYDVGIGIGYAQIVLQEETGVLGAIGHSTKYTVDLLGQMVSALAHLPASLGNMFTTDDTAVGEPIGPVGIARATGEVVEQGGMIAFWNLMAILSLNLFLLNLLPIPALDGSHIIFSLIELVRGGKKVPPDKEALVHAMGFAALMGLMLVISVNDIINAFQGRSVLGG